MSLDKDEVALLLVRRAAPKVIETDFVQRRRRSVTRNMAPVLGIDAIGIDHHGHRIPADVRLDTTFERAIPRVFGLTTLVDRVQVCRIRAIRQVRARAASEVDHLVQQEVRPFRAMLREDRINRLQPFTGLGRIDVVEGVETAHILSTRPVSRNCCSARELRDASC